MIRFIYLFVIFFLPSCGGVEFVLSDKTESAPLKNNTLVFLEGTKKESFAEEMFLFFGNNKKGDYILVSSYDEKKENRLVKKNQVAEKIDYKLIINYELFYLNQECKIYSQKVTSGFSFVPKSSGYNFGADMSLENQTTQAIKENIKTFLSSVPIDTVCKNES